jgi:hypothetical protein
MLGKLLTHQTFSTAKNNYLKSLLFFFTNLAKSNSDNKKVPKLRLSASWNFHSYTAQIYEYFSRDQDLGLFPVR